MTGPVLAATAWPTNGHLIAACHQLGYIRSRDRVLDPTHGRGVWWTIWRPDDLTTSDLAHDGTDYRHLPWVDNLFDVVAFDPDYVAQGGESKQLADYHHRYGRRPGTTPEGVQANIDAGLTEALRVVKPRGTILAKCQDYVWSGRLWPGTHHTLTHALTIGLELVDRLEHVGRARPQPTTNPDGTPRAQKHARRNLSTLLVLRAPARKPQPALDLGGDP